MVRLGLSAVRRTATWSLLMLSIVMLQSPARAQRPTVPEVFVGIVIRISDGDTLWVQPDATPGATRRKPVKVRLVGLDAPERCQAHGPQATEALTRWALHRRVEVRRRAIDEHGRALGTLWIEGEDVGVRLVREGHAWSARYRGDPGPYAREEAEARTARRGLFAEAAPQPPREFRREHGPCP
jgi:endonuclease YncB( thermonuclease family)